MLQLPELHARYATVVSKLVASMATCTSTIYIYIPRKQAPYIALLATANPALSSF